MAILRFTENEPQIAVAHLFPADTVTIRLYDPVTGLELETYANIAFEIQDTGRFYWNLTNLVELPSSRMLIYIMRNQDGIEQTGFIDLNPLSDQDEVLAKIQKLIESFNAIRDFPALLGVVENNDHLFGIMEEEELVGIIAEDGELTGFLEEEELVGIVESDSLISIVTTIL